MLHVKIKNANFEIKKHFRSHTEIRLPQLRRFLWHIFSLGTLSEITPSYNLLCASLYSGSNGGEEGRCVGQDTKLLCE